MSGDQTTRATQICALTDLSAGGTATRFTFERDGRSHAAFVVATKASDRSGASRVCAYLNVCPHRGTELDWQPGVVFDDTGDHLMCATHAALFEPETGRCVAGPCRGSSLTTVEVFVDAGGVLLSPRAGRLLGVEPRQE